MPYFRFFCFSFAFPLWRVRKLKKVSSHAGSVQDQTSLTWSCAKVHSRFWYLTYQALYDLRPGYLKDHLYKCHPAHALHSAEEALLCVPLAGRKGRAILVAAPCLWNSPLPPGSVSLF